MKNWILAARPKTLFAAFAPVLIGTAMASTEVLLDWFYVAVVFIGAFAIQIGTNFANDYFDFKQGADTEERQAHPCSAGRTDFCKGDVDSHGAHVRFGRGDVCRPCAKSRNAVTDHWGYFDHLRNLVYRGALLAGVSRFG